MRFGIRVGAGLVCCLAGLIVAGCSRPYGVLMTPGLLDRVEGIQPGNSASVKTCPDTAQTYGDSHRPLSRLISHGDSISARVLAGGRADLTACHNFEGFSSIRPDWTVLVGQADADLTIKVDSNEDTVLLVQQPDGSLAFDDDSGESTNGKLTLAAADKGTYNIWVGTFSAEAAFKPVATVTATLSR